MNLLMSISGYLWPSSGTVTIDGCSYGHVSLGDVRRKIGLIEPSRAPRFDDAMRVREVVATGFFGTVVLPPHQSLSSGQWQRAARALSSAGLDGFADRPYGQLSTGEQMKTLLSRVMVSDARLLLLDEPTVGLDMAARAACIDVLDALLARPVPPTVVIVSHHLDELPRAVAQVALMKQGRVVDRGSPDTLLTSVRLSELFDCRVDVIKRDGRYVATVRGGRR